MKHHEEKQADIVDLNAYRPRPVSVPAQNGNGEAKVSLVTHERIHMTWQRLVNLVVNFITGARVLNVRSWWDDQWQGIKTHIWMGKENE